LILWVDAQVSPALASWITENFGVEAHPLRDLGLLHARDQQIYQAAREAGAAVMTKDSDFLGLLDRLGSPPQVLWITCGNTSNTRLRQVLQSALPMALKLLDQGDSLVEISDAK
jgi:predicted nuclease of predicted toxin-antitoxin system